MAEATLERQPNTFFCHQCMRVVVINIPAYTCSRCNSGFIEELERPQPSSSSSVHTSDTAAQISQVCELFK
ncbi:E3 ubiquitin-protein ligase RNF126 [Biomphalaria pfeifferi]|uniref:RING-type E3 ubiquitin transferase n=1 Tax=Biomphalaria pfeifferi TaxID=112525 RepID=A0AAD8CEJ5_BIOPF|nr:E3 ubiquitin-protein ligase RNF126 [Biomphalaria pfeifferi]